MPKYAALIYNPSDLDGHHNPDILQEYGVFMQSAEEAGVLVMGEPLEDPSTATTVTVADGKRGGKGAPSDRPLAETKEIPPAFIPPDRQGLAPPPHWAAHTPGALHREL